MYDRKKLLNYMDEQSGSENEKKEMLASLDKLNMILYDNIILHKFKRKLFGTHKDQYILTHLEFSVCFLANTKKYYPEVITDILSIDTKRFKEVVQSLEAKMVKNGCRLPKGYKAMQPLIHEYCSLIG